VRTPSIPENSSRGPVMPPVANPLAPTDLRLGSSPRTVAALMIGHPFQRHDRAIIVVPWALACPLLPNQNGEHIKDLGTAGKIRQRSVFKPSLTICEYCLDSSRQHPSEKIVAFGCGCFSRHDRRELKRPSFSLRLRPAGRDAYHGSLPHWAALVSLVA
jgi:hypothetical protein